MKKSRFQKWSFFSLILLTMAFLGLIGKSSAACQIGIGNSECETNIPSPLFIIVLLFVLFLVSVFWIWMFLDALDYCDENRFFWIVFLVVFNLPASIIYFFTHRRKNKKIENEIMNEDMAEDNDSQEEDEDPPPPVSSGG